MNSIRCRLLAVALIALAPSVAHAQNFSYGTTDKGGTITTGGTAQNAIAANIYRRNWCIQNDPSATEILSVRLNGTASATSGIILQAGQQACNQAGSTDTTAISVYAATTGHRWFGFEGQ